jgi:hypothetical protein
MTARKVMFMSIKLTDTQLVMLSAGAQHDDRCLAAPRNPKGGAAQKVAAKLIDGGLAKEIKAKPGGPVWRQDERAGQSFALKLTAAGVRAIAIDDRSASDDTTEGLADAYRSPPLTRNSPSGLLSKYLQRGLSNHTFARSSGGRYETSYRRREAKAAKNTPQNRGPANMTGMRVPGRPFPRRSG